MRRIVERVREHERLVVDPVAPELLVAQRLGAGHQLAGRAAAQAALAQPVLRPGEGARKQVVHELAIDAAMAGDVAVMVGGALPHADGGEVRRFQRRRVPLVHGEVGDAVHPDLAAAPRLHGGPFNAGMDVARLAWRPWIEEAWRAASAARIDPYAHVAVRHPFLRIDHFPRLVQVARSGRDLGKRGDHPLPGSLVAVLERQPFAERPVGEDDRVGAIAVRAEHVGAQHDAVVHRDRRIPVDPHSVAHLGLGRRDRGIHGIVAGFIEGGEDRLLSNRRVDKAPARLSVAARPRRPPCTCRYGVSPSCHGKGCRC